MACEFPQLHSQFCFCEHEDVIWGEVLRWVHNSRKLTLSPAVLVCLSATSGNYRLLQWGENCPCVAAIDPCWTPVWFAWLTLSLFPTFFFFFGYQADIYCLHTEFYFHDHRLLVFIPHLPHIQQIVRIAIVPWPAIDKYPRPAAPTVHHDAIVHSGVFGVCSFNVSNSCQVPLKLLVFGEPSILILHYDNRKV